MEIGTTLATVASIFIIMLLGYGAKRMRVLKSSDAEVVNAIIVYLMFPAFIFVYIHGKALAPDMYKATALCIAGEAVIMCLAYGVGRLLKLDRCTTAGLMLVAAFGNTGFLGYPVVSAAFAGRDNAILSAVMIDEFGMSLIMITLGIAVVMRMVQSKATGGGIVGLLKFPPFALTIVALCLRTTYIPPVIMKTLGYLAAATVPLAMISIGLTLSSGPIRKFPAALSAAFVMKMLVLPLLMLLGLRLAGVHGTIRQVGILEGAMPSAVMAGVFARRFGANGQFAACAVFVTTLASVVVIPLVLMLVG